MHDKDANELRYMLGFNLLQSLCYRRTAVTNGAPNTPRFPTCRRRRVEARFDGGAVSSDGGVLLASSEGLYPELR